MQEKEIQEQINKIAKRIKKLRIEKGYTNYENFAFKHDLPRAQYGRYEKGTDMRISSLLKVLAALDISPSDFFKGIEND